MKLNHKSRTIILLIIAAIFFISGFSQMLFHFNIDKNISNKIDMFLFVLAGVLFLNGRKNKQNEKEREQKQEVESDSDSDSDKKL